jgi:hypothetical protein
VLTPEEFMILSMNLFEEQIPVVERWKECFLRLKSFLIKKLTIIVLFLYLCRKQHDQCCLPIIGIYPRMVSEKISGFFFNAM